MTRHIGIVACSNPGAALCYQTICNEGAELMGEHDHPEITLHNHSLAQYMDCIYKEDWQGVADLMLSSARICAGAGADFCISPDNTIHQAFPYFIEDSPVPWLHIADVVAGEALKHGYKTIGVLGTKYLMTGPVYPEAFERAGLDFRIPDEETRTEMDRIIFSELVYHRIKEESRSYFYDVIQGLKSEGCDAVVLGCTEIPLIVRPEESELPTLDSTRLLGRSALEFALKS